MIKNKHMKNCVVPFQLATPPGSQVNHTPEGETLEYSSILEYVEDRSRFSSITRKNLLEFTRKRTKLRYEGLVLIITVQYLERPWPSFD